MRDKMQLISIKMTAVRNIALLFFAAWYCSMSVSAQSVGSIDDVKMSLAEAIGKASQREDMSLQNIDRSMIVNDSIFRLYDVDIDLSLGEVSFDLTWGDPIRNPQIRCNKASNLYGPVRHNSDGSIRWHRGFDYYAPMGTPVYSVGNGVVSLIQKDHPDYGMCVLVTHKRPKQTYYSFYAHLSSISVKYGERVRTGSVLGKSGKSGNAYNLSGNEVHLHFECRTSPKHGDRKQINPNTILRTKFYSADPDNKWQSNVGVIKK